MLILSQDNIIINHLIDNYGNSKLFPLRFLAFIIILYLIVIVIIIYFEFFLRVIKNYKSANLKIRANNVAKRGDLDVRTKLIMHSRKVAPRMPVTVPVRIGNFTHATK